MLLQNIIQRGQRGDVTGAFEEALKYSLAIGMAGGSVENARNFLRSGFDPDALADVDDAMFESLAKIFFVSKYTREKFLESGQFGSYAMNLVQPAFPSIIDKAGKAVDNILFEQDNDLEAFNTAMRNIPVAGTGYYYWLGGGAEKVIERVQEEQRED